MNYEIQFAKVTCSGKIQDRFLSAKRQKTQDLTKYSMGEVFSLIEILSPWYNSAQIGQMIINNFSSAYYLGGSTSDLQNFEAAIKKINENLAQITQNGETEWIGNLNGILATIVGDSLILTTSGKAEVFLFRDGKINHLTEGLAAKIEVHPLKTFSNVISGQLKTNDKVLIANKSLFDNLSLESLHQIITLNTPSVAAQQIVKLLRKAKVKNVNFFIINLLSKEELANSPIRENEESVFYLDKSNESVLSKVKSAWQTILSPIGNIIRAKGSNIISKTAKGVLKFKNNLKDRKDNKTISNHEIQKKMKPELAEDKEADAFQKEFMSYNPRDDELLKDEEIKYSPELAVHYYQEKKKIRKESKLKNIVLFIVNFLKSIFIWLKELYLDKNRRKYFYIIVAAILILIIGLVVSFRGKGGNNLGNLESQKILDEAIAAQKDGKNSLSLGDTEKAKNQLVNAIAKAQLIKSSNLVAKDAEAVITTSYQELDKLTSTTRYNSLEPIVSLSDTAKGFFINSGEAFLITETDIYKSSLLGGKPQKVATLPKSKGNFLSGTNFGNIIYLYTSNQMLFEFSPTTNKLDQAKIVDTGRWETANAVSNYVGSLYLLDGVIGQIYKHSSSTDVFQKGEEYLSASKGLKQSISFAIDGAIYVLKDDGTALKFQRAKLQDFSLKNIPTPWDKINGARKIYTDSDTPSLYILDTEQKRILEFDKDGVFIRQYALPQNFDKITDFNVSVKSKKIWILNDKNLYEITI